MPTLPWQKLTTNPVPYETTAMLTYLPLKHWRDTPRFLIYIIKIYVQLRKTPGLVGFSMRANPLSKNYWTLSRWESEQAIDTYIHTPPHVNIMENMHGKMEQTAFVSWKVKNAHQELRWSEALNRSTQSYH